MAVVMLMRWKGVTPEQYEGARKLVNWEGDVPSGAMYHVAAFGEGELRVVDVWESAEAFNAFAERVGLDESIGFKQISTLQTETDSHFSFTRLRNCWGEDYYSRTCKTPGNPYYRSYPLHPR